jgi:hypothetical protein
MRLDDAVAELDAYFRVPEVRNDAQWYEDVEPYWREYVEPAWLQRRNG